MPLDPLDYIGHSARRVAYSRQDFETVLQITRELKDVSLRGPLLIEPLPLGILPWITGAELMRPSRLMARKRPTFSPVTLANSRAPRLLSVKLTCQKPGRSAYEELKASVSWSPAPWPCM